METEAHVYVDIGGLPVLAGRLWVRVRKSRESATFEYDPGWLDRTDRFSLEPALALDPGPFHTSSRKPLFGAERLRLTRTEIDRVASAFTHKDLQAALSGSA